MRSKFCCRIGSVLCAIAVALWVAAAFFVTSAASAQGSLKIICKSEGYPLFAQNWSVYRVGELTGAGKIEFQGEFADSQVYLPDLSVSSLQDAASSLENFALLEPVKPDASEMSDLNGFASFEGLEDGVYLASGTKISKGNKIYTPAPMLIEVKGGKSVTTYAKYTVKDKPTIDTEMYVVKKVWQYDDHYIESRPVEIEVAIYRDNAFVEKVTLSKANDWTYSWSGSPQYDWRVKELNIHVDYKIVYRHNETQYLLINNRDVLSNSDTTTQGTTTSTTTSVTSRPVITMTSTTESTTGTTGRVTGYSSTTTETSTVTRETVTSSGSETSTTTSGDVGELTTTSTETVTTESGVTGTTTSGERTTTIKGTTTKPSGGGKLPQTGQLWWPVPACGAAGLVLFAIGWKLNRKK